AAPRVDRDRERGAHGCRVVRDHHSDLELVETLAEHRHADQAAAILGHEVDCFGSRLVRGHDEVPLVLPVFVVDDEDDAALPDLLDGLVDRREHGHCAPLSASDRCRYFPMTSISTFTDSPSASPPKVVTASVCGITMTSKVVTASAATVRLTPSTATDPCGI